MDQTPSKNNIVKFIHSDPWRQAYMAAGDDPQRLKQLCGLLMAERDWHIRCWVKAGYTPPEKHMPPNW